MEPIHEVESEGAGYPLLSADHLLHHAVFAVEEMVERHIRHMPVVDRDDRVIGMLSFRHVMQDRIEDLRHEVYALEAYLGYDGAVG